MLDKALVLAQSLEMAHTLQGEISAGRQLNSPVSRQVSGAMGTALTREVHKVSPPHKGKPDHSICYCCGKAGHKAA